jgi:hypothetical protein
MSGLDFPVFPQATEDARALLARLYREIGVSAVAVALDLDQAPEGQEAHETLASLLEQNRRVRAA